VTTEYTSIHLILMMLTEMDIETSVYYVHLTRLIAREDFIKFTRRESTKTYNVTIVTMLRKQEESKDSENLEHYSTKEQQNIQHSAL
jgi:hypothetical protein